MNNLLKFIGEKLEIEKNINVVVVDGNSILKLNAMVVREGGAIDICYNNCHGISTFYRYDIDYIEFKNNEYTIKLK